MRSEGRTSASPAWVDEVPAIRTVVDPSADDDHEVRQHNAAVLRIAAAHIDAREGSAQLPSLVAEWLEHLADQADRQAEVWTKAASVLRAEAKSFTRSRDVETPGRVVVDRLHDKASIISHGRMSSY